MAEFDKKLWDTIQRIDIENGTIMKSIAKLQLAKMEIGIKIKEQRIRQRTLRNRKRILIHKSGNK